MTDPPEPVATDIGVALNVPPVVATDIGWADANVVVALLLLLLLFVVPTDIGWDENMGGS